MNTTSYEEWLDADDDFDPAADMHPERNFATPEVMAKILGLSTRHLRRLVKGGLVSQRADGQFAKTDTLDRYLAHKAAEPLPVSASMRQKQAELIQRRLDREAEELIDRPGLETTLATITGAFLGAIIEVGETAGEGLDEPERARRREIARQAAERLDGKMQVEISELLTGKRAGDE